MVRAFVLASLCALLVAPAAPAGPPHCPPGHAKKGWCGPGGGWRVGAHAPRERWVVVRDWDARRLPAPGRDRLWVEIDGDVLLIAAATGLILEALAR